MTLIGNAVRRETFAQVFDRGSRPVIVSIEPPCLVGFRLKGTRRTYYLTADRLWWVAMKAHVAAEKAEKRKARKERAV